MKYIRYSLFAALLLLAGAAMAQSLQRYTASLPATDGLGRALPTREEVGETRDDRFVGLFYWTWHTNFAGMEPFDVTKFLAAHPEALADYDHPAWGGEHATHFWGEPLFGYYRDTDEWVLRKHAEMLGEAGVDVLIFDCTNGNFTWKESYMKLCEVFAQARAEGVQTPQIAFILAFGPTQGSHEALRELYEDLYRPGLYRDLWFQWKGKPLIMAWPESLDESDAEDRAIRDFFTFRPGQPDYKAGPSRPDHWGWLEIYPQHAYGEGVEGRPEEVPVGVAQNWSDERGLTAMNAPGSFGRSYTCRAGQAPDSIVTPEGTRQAAVRLGLNFDEQWQRALELDPEFIFVTGWNEWIAGRFRLWQQQENAFPDEFSQEKSRDIEPMRGGHGDDYYWQMVAAIRRYKGMPAASGAYLTHRGNTLHRHHPGWGTDTLTNTTGRNDIVSCRVRESASRLTFIARCAERVTAPDGTEGWMRLHLDTDGCHATGWEGYDYTVNRLTPQERRAILERYADGQWQRVGEVRLQRRGKSVHITIPKQQLGLAPRSAFALQFKWSDNVQGDDILSFWTDGDVAPMGRFNYPYVSK